jgi:hypothetical protein
MDHVINYLQIYDEKTNKTFQRGIITPEVSDAGCSQYSQRKCLYG